MLLSLIGRPEEELEEFLQYESKKSPPTLADDQGRMRPANKANIVSCLKKELEKSKKQQTDVQESQLLNVNDGVLDDLYVCNQLHIDSTDNEDDPMNYIDRNDFQTEADCVNHYNPNEESEDEIHRENSNSDDKVNEVHPEINPLDSVTACFLDGPTLVQMIVPKTGIEFNFYADKQFIPYVINKCKKNVTKIDLLFDVYKDTEYNLEQQTHDKRGERYGPETCIKGYTLVPSGLRKWKFFLIVKSNKTALYTFLAEKLAAISSRHLTLYSTDREHVLVNREPSEGSPNGSIHTLAPCNYSEADT